MHASLWMVKRIVVKVQKNHRLFNLLLFKFTVECLLSFLLAFCLLFCVSHTPKIPPYRDALPPFVLQIHHIPKIRNSKSIAS